MSDLVAMGGHGVFVWGAYGVTLLALIWEMLALLRRRRILRRRRRPSQRPSRAPSEVIPRRSGGPRS